MNTREQLDLQRYFRSSVDRSSKSPQRLASRVAGIGLPNRSRGFTLVELLVLIAIIAILIIAKKADGIIATTQQEN